MNRCLECADVITNPICSHCLTQTIGLWLAERSPKLSKNLELFDAEGDTPCLFCHRRMSICPHCTSRDVYDYLSERDKKLAEEFAARFDFELREAGFVF